MTAHFDYFDKLQGLKESELRDEITMLNTKFYALVNDTPIRQQIGNMLDMARDQLNITVAQRQRKDCLLYTSPSPRDATLSRMPSSA